MISNLSIERRSIILETTQLSIMRNKQKGKGKWVAGKEDSWWTLDMWGERHRKRTCQSQLKNRIRKKDKEERLHDAETNARITKKSVEFSHLQVSPARSKNNCFA